MLKYYPLLLFSYLFAGPFNNSDHHGTNISDHLNIQFEEMDTCFVLPMYFNSLDTLNQIQIIRNAAECFFSVYDTLQNHGGWWLQYNYPELRPWAFTFGYMDEYLYNSGFQGGTGVIGMGFIHAFRVLQDASYINILTNIADHLIEVQNSQIKLWQWNSIITENGVIIDPNENFYQFEEQVQSFNIYILLFVYNETGDDGYLNAAVDAANSIVEFQNEYGGFPQGILIEDGIPIPFGTHHDGIMALSVFNDETHYGLMQALRTMYEFTNDITYLESFKKAAEFLLISQIDSGPESGAWSEQYDINIQPCWGRHFEPLGSNMRSVRDNLQLLLWIFDMTGDESYRTAFDNGLSYVLSKEPYIRLDGEEAVAEYYDLETGHPIFANTNYVIYDMTVPSEIDSAIALTGFVGTQSEFLDQNVYKNWQLSDVLNQTPRNLDKLLNVRTNDITREDIYYSSQGIYPPTMEMVYNECFNNFIWTGNSTFEEAKYQLQIRNELGIRTWLDGGQEIFEFRNNYISEVEMLLKSIEYFSVINGDKDISEIFQWDGLHQEQIIFPNGYDFSIPIVLWDNLNLSIDDYDQVFQPAFILNQNFPNPFNSITTINYELYIQSDVNIIIYDILGSVVQTFDYTQLSPGSKSIIWDAVDNLGRSVSSGVYYYKLDVKDNLQTRKMIILK